MTIQERHHLYNIVVLDLDGLFNSPESQELFNKSVRDLLEKGFRSIVIDILDVVHISSAVFGDMIRMHNSVSQQKGRVIVIANEKMTNIFLIAKLASVFSIASSEEEAVKNLSEPPDVTLWEKAFTWLFPRRIYDWNMFLKALNPQKRIVGQLEQTRLAPDGVLFYITFTGTDTRGMGIGFTSGPMGVADMAGIESDQVYNAVLIRMFWRLREVQDLQPKRPVLLRDEHGFVISSAMIQSALINIGFPGISSL